MKAVKPTGLTVSRVDVVDYALNAWAVAYLLIIRRLDAVPTFPAGYALILLTLAILAYRFFVPEGRRPIQLLASAILGIMTGTAIALSPLETSFELALVKAGVAAALWGLAAMAVRECMASALGVTTASTLEINDLRLAFLIPAVTFGLVTVVTILLPAFSKSSWVWLIVLSLWLVGAGLNWLFLRNLPEVVFRFHLDNPRLWRKLFGGPRVVVSTIAAIWVIGLILETILHGRNYVVWTLVTGLITLYALAILELGRQARRIEQEPHPMDNPLGLA